MGRFHTMVFLFHTMGFLFLFFFFYFSCITRIYAIFIANWILYVDYYILHTRCYRCRIAILFGFTVWLYYTVMALLGYLMFFGLPLRCGGWDILPNRPSRPGKEWMMEWRYNYITCFIQEGWDGFYMLLFSYYTHSKVRTE